MTVQPAGDPDAQATPDAPSDGAGSPDATHTGDTGPWAEADRPRGLDAYFAPGGEDLAPPERVADERRLLRLLALMIAILVGVPLLLTLVGLVAQLVSLRVG